MEGHRESDFHSPERIPQQSDPPSGEKASSKVTHPLPWEAFVWRPDNHSCLSQTPLSASPELWAPLNVGALSHLARDQHGVYMSGRD